MPNRYDHVAVRGTTRQRRTPEKLKKVTDYKRTEGKAVGAKRRKRHNEQRHRGKPRCISPQQRQDAQNAQEKQIRAIARKHRAISNGDLPH